MSPDTLPQSDLPTDPDIPHFEDKWVSADRSLYKRVKVTKSIADHYEVSNDDPEEVEKKKRDYEKFTQDSKELYGFLSHENPLYGKLRGALDRVLKAAHIEPGSVKLDCVLDDTANARVVPSGNHIFLNIGTLFKIKKDGLMSLDVVAGILAHEIVHIKYKNKTNNHAGKLDKSIRQYTLSREEERIADIEAVEILNRAGFNPNAITTLFEFFANEDSKDDDHDFVMSGVDGIIYDPHESNQRRVDYLKEHIGNHLFKHRDKDHEAITEADINLQNEDYGFLYLLHSSRPNKAIEAIKQPWQLVYVCNFLKRANILDLFKSQINSLKATVLLPALSDFNPQEQELIWDILIREEDYNPEESASITENKNINLTKVVVFLPNLFPDSKMKYCHPIDSSLNVDFKDFYSPLEKVMTTIVSSLSLDIPTAFFKKWGEEKPEWITNFIDVFGQTFRKSNFISDYVLEKEEVIADLFIAIQKSNIELGNDQKMAIFRIIQDCTGQEASEGIAYLKANDHLHTFCCRHLVNEKPEPNQHAYLQSKYEFLKILKRADDFLESQNYDSRNSYELLPMTSGIDIHRRSILLGMNKHFSEIDPLLKDSGNKITYRAVNKLYYDILLRPKPFPWEAGIRDKKPEKKKTAESKFDDLGNPLGSWEIPPYQFWSAVLLDLTLQEPEGPIEIGAFRDILSSDIDVYTLANIICYQLSGKRKKPCRNHLKKLSKNNKKAKQVKDLVDLALTRKKNLKALPPIFERNYLFLQQVQKSRHKLQTYLEIKEYFIQEDKSVLHRRLDEEFANGELHQKIISMIMANDAGTVYHQTLLGPANHAMDEAAFLAWKELEQTRDYTALNLSGKIEFIKSFFPDISFHKEEILTELPANTTEELQLILTHLDLPVFRYRIGDKIWKLNLDRLSASTLDEKMQLLFEGFPSKDCGNGLNILLPRHQNIHFHHYHPSLQELIFEFPLWNHSIQ